MKTFFVLLWIGVSFVVTAGAETEAERNLKAFPPPEAGVTRHVLMLEPADDEQALRVELQIGKTVRTDGVNRHFFAGNLQAVNVEGWGFTRYVLEELGPMAGTLIAVEPGAPTVERFVMLGREPQLLRYNSRLPLVVYVPEGVEVRHRIWRADPEAAAVPQG